MTFPDGFLWGAATASHQVEGGNVNNHYWEWEHAPRNPFAEPSGDAVDHHHCRPEDLDLFPGAPALSRARAGPDRRAHPLHHAALVPPRRLMAGPEGRRPVRPGPNVGSYPENHSKLSSKGGRPTTFVRTSKPSLAWLGEVARRNGLPEHPRCATAG